MSVEILTCTPGPTVMLSIMSIGGLMTLSPAGSPPRRTIMIVGGVMFLKPTPG